MTLEVVKANRRDAQDAGQVSAALRFEMLEVNRQLPEPPEGLCR